MPDTSHPYYTGIQTALSAIASGRVYPDQLPNDPALPAVRYALLGDRPHQRLADGDNTTADLQVDVYAARADADGAWPIDAAIRAALDRQQISATGFTTVRIVCTERGRPFKEAGYFRIVSQFRLYGSAA